jgi:hypothetical protein
VTQGHAPGPFVLADVFLRVLRSKVLLCGLGSDMLLRRVLRHDMLVADVLRRKVLGGVMMMMHRLRFCCIRDACTENHRSCCDSSGQGLVHWWLRKKLQRPEALLDAASVTPFHLS